MDHVQRVEAFFVNGEASPVQLGESLNLFDVDVKRLIRAIDFQSPFYPNEIFQHLELLVKIALRAGRRVTSCLEGSVWSWDDVRKGKENFDQFCKESDAVSNLIRERISKLSVYAGRLDIVSHV